MGDVRLSPHFLLSEFSPHDGGTVPPKYVPSLRSLCVLVLEPLRVEFGVCHVVSGLRTVKHNAAVGGAKESHHLYALDPLAPAADVRFAKGTPAQWAARADRLLRTYGGIGTYRTHVHIDRRKGKARWVG